MKHGTKTKTRVGVYSLFARRFLTHPPAQTHTQPAPPTPNPQPRAMADDAPVTFNDLPDDMLHEIFGRVFQDVPKGDEDPTDATAPPRGIHLTLRSVCRRWRGVADWAELANDKIRVYANMLADVDAVLCRHPAAIKHLTITEELGLNASGTGTLHSTLTPSAVASLIGGNPDLRRSMTTLTITLCCSPSLLWVVTPVATCSALTELMIGLYKHKRQRAVPADVLAPLSALPWAFTPLKLAAFPGLVNVDVCLDGQPSACGRWWRGRNCGRSSLAIPPAHPP